MSHKQRVVRGVREQDEVFLDILENRRIVIAYVMTVGGKRISASQGTVEIEPAGAGTKLTYTEQGALLDGLGSPKQREEGCRWLLETALANELQRHGKAG